MIENVDSLPEDIEQTEINQDNPIIPAKWGDIFLYLGGSYGVFLIGGVVIGLIYREINLAFTVLTALLNFLCFAGGVYLFGVRRGKLTWEGIGLIPPKFLGLSALIGGVIAFVLFWFRVGLILLAWLAGINFDSLAGRETLFAAGMDSWLGIVLSLVGIGVLAPIAEELLFRGLVYDWFRQKMPIWAAVVFSSLLFGLGHYDSWLVVVSAFIMGLALALSYELSKSIWVPIFTHIFTNSAAILLMVVLENAVPNFY